MKYQVDLHISEGTPGHSLTHGICATYEAERPIDAVNAAITAAIEQAEEPIMSIHVGEPRPVE